MSSKMSAKLPHRTLSHPLPFMSFVSFFRSALRPLSFVVAVFAATVAFALLVFVRAVLRRSTGRVEDAS